jgi:hypothetical protein
MMHDLHAAGGTDGNGVLGVLATSPALTNPAVAEHALKSRLYRNAKSPPGMYAVAPSFVISRLLADDTPSSTSGVPTTVAVGALSVKSVGAKRAGCPLARRLGSGISSRAGHIAAVLLLIDPLTAMNSSSRQGGETVLMRIGFGFCVVVCWFVCSFIYL